MAAVTDQGLEIISMSIFQFKVGDGLFCHRMKSILL